MPDYAGEYLTTRELADLLRIKERKVYDLAASGDIPCTRALGKLLFRRTAIDAWLARHDTGDTGAPTTFPSVFLGSHDPLLEWALRESDSGLANFMDGSLDGLERMTRAEGIGTGLHVFDAATGDWNAPIVMDRFKGKPVVLVEWAWRERGLIVAPGNPHGISAVPDLKGRRVAARPAQAGSQVLLQHHLEQAGIAEDDTFSRSARTETDAVLAVLEGETDAAFGLFCVAGQYRLDFVPVLKERFDLLVWRSEWFEPPFQSLLALTRSPTFQNKAATMKGYDISGLGTVHYNGR